MFQEIQTRDVIILGCGAVLFGDDAFGPAVVERLLARGCLPGWAHAEDVGTSVRDILFNIALAEKRPRRVIVLDAVQIEGRQPGEVFELDISSMPKIKLPDFSFHQFPTTNMLYELREHAGIDVRVVVAQAADIPDHISEGMSPDMEAAVDVAARLVLELCDLER